MKDMIYLPTLLEPVGKTFQRCIYDRMETKNKTLYKQCKNVSEGCAVLVRVCIINKYVQYKRGTSSVSARYLTIVLK